jgi:hypothetical protein
MWLENTEGTVNNVVFSNINDSPTTRQAAALFIREGNPVIKNCSFSNNSIGIEINKGAPIVENCAFLNNSTGIEIEKGTSEIKNNVFEENDIPINLFISASPIFSNNHQNTQNNDLNGIIVVPEEEMSTTTWQADLPYVINKITLIPQESTLILEQGVIIKFESKTQMNVYGKILTEGTPSQPVVFTSLKDDDYGNDTNNDETSSSPYYVDDYYSIRFYSSGSILDGTIIRYGGTTMLQTIGAIALEENVQIEIKNSLIKENRVAISFPGGTSCETINEVIDGFIAQNTAFENNYYNSYPECD